jgi:hypothetical protein
MQIHVDSSPVGDDVRDGDVCGVYCLGVHDDDRLDDRLADLVRAGEAPTSALPGLATWLDQPFDRAAFAGWVAGHGEHNIAPSPVGRRLRGTPPDDLESLVRSLLSLLTPLGDGYPIPHYRRGA